MIVHQPYDKQLGVSLIEELQSKKYNTLTIMVAYAKLSGVYRILPYLIAFKKEGGKIRGVVGIDQQNTTYDALVSLNQIMDELYVFHSEGFTQTFHIKCYWLSGHTDIWYAIGSNNLTAGGLFSNYEMSETDQLPIEKAQDVLSRLEDIFRCYSASSSACSYRVNQPFLDLLLNQNYIVKEIQQRKEFAKARKKQTTSSAGAISVFGKEVFSAPKLPVEYRKQAKANRKSVKNTANVEMPSKIVEPSSTIESDNTYLIRLIPKAGDRSKQVHFTQDLLQHYFKLKAGDDILVQEMLPNGNVCTIEPRHIVLSKANGNVKIELSGAEILDTNYPKNEDTRPVLIFKRINSNFFVYMLLFDGNKGYCAINDHLKTLSTGRSLPYEVIDESTMFDLWEECPLM